MNPSGPFIEDGGEAVTERPVPGSGDAFAIINLQERERVRVGFDLHDGPAQTMSAALLQVRMLEDLEGDALRSGLEELRETISTALAEIYELIDDLGGHRGDQGDFIAHVRALVDDLSERTGVQGSLTIDGEEPSMSKSLQIALFRIIQEGLSNVRRHAKAHRVDIHLRFTRTETSCEIRDDGQGFSMDAPMRSRHGREPFGLRSMSQRARLLNGDCVVLSHPGEGTRIEVRIPAWLP
jgi:two-component system sensor histidine kinase DegS